MPTRARCGWQQHPGPRSMLALGARPLRASGSSAIMCAYFWVVAMAVAGAGAGRASGASARGDPIHPRLSDLPAAPALARPITPSGRRDRRYHVAFRIPQMPRRAEEDEDAGRRMCAGAHGDGMRSAAVQGCIELTKAEIAGPVTAPNLNARTSLES